VDTSLALYWSPHMMMRKRSWHGEKEERERRSMALPNVNVQVSGLPSKLVKDLQLYMQSSFHKTIRGSQIWKLWV